MARPAWRVVDEGAELGGESGGDAGGEIERRGREKNKEKWWVPCFGGGFGGSDMKNAGPFRRYVGVEF